GYLVRRAVFSFLLLSEAKLAEQHLDRPDAPLVAHGEAALGRIEQVFPRLDVADENRKNRLRSATAEDLVVVRISGRIGVAEDGDRRLREGPNHRGQVD